MKKIIIPFLCIISILFVLLNINTITDKIIIILNPLNQSNIIENNSEYPKPDYSFVQNTNNDNPLGKQDLLNIFYTVLNNGLDTYTFYCPKEYKSCINDVTNISKDENLLTHLNNFVHPFNSFASISTDISDSGEITIKIKYIYDSDQINQINAEIDKLLNTLITEDLTDDYDKIKSIHDYIINNTKYDIDNNKELQSYNAYGTLFNHLATCNGYTDLMAIYLSKMGYDNYKVATTNETTGHVWNAVKINDEWLHLDLTWDDPVSNDGKDYLYHKYFLINTDELITADSNITSNEHNFDASIYTELKNHS